VIRCENCGGEVEEGRGSCPQCGKPIAAPGEQLVTAPEPPRAVPMESFGARREERDSSHLVIYGAVALFALLLIGGLSYLASRPSARPGDERLEGAVRPGSPDYPDAGMLVVEFDPNENALIGPTALGPWAVTFKPVVRNFTGRTITGLEFRVAGLDPKGNVIRERIAINRDEIEPNKVHTPPLGINFPQDNKPADLKLELTGVRFK
jgi:hypothetical protein